MAEIVRLCSDTTRSPKPSWLERKRAYVRRLAAEVDKPEPNVGYLRVTLADKLHNARAIRDDVDRHGDSVYDRFARSSDSRAERKRRQLAYYHDLTRAFARYVGDDVGIRALRAKLRTVVRSLDVSHDDTLFDDHDPGS